MGDYTKKLSQRLRVKGPAVGHCVICGKFGPLTKDHVPPRGCNNVSDVILLSFAESNHSQSQSKTTIAQGGTHFRTLCGTCNNTRLGGDYDPELVKLSNEITNFARAVSERRIVLPESIVAWVKPQRIARAVLGHVLAAHSVSQVKSPPISAPLSNAIQKYFLDPNESLPKELDIYFGVYPHKRQVIIKNAGKISLSRNGGLFGHIIKFLPLGFWILREKPKGVSIELPALVPDKGMGFDDMHQLTISLRGLPAIDFPEAPADDEAIFFADEHTSIGYPR